MFGLRSATVSLRDEIDPRVLTYRKMLATLDLLKRQPGPTIDATFEVVGEDRSEARLAIGSTEQTQERPANLSGDNS